MTTARKLWLGFGTLTALLVLSVLAILARVQSIGTAVREQADVARPRAAAARELEVSVVGYALAVRTFVQTDDPKFRREAEEDAADVGLQLAEYERLVRTERQRRLAARFAVLWREYEAFGRAVLNSKVRPVTREDSERLADLRAGLEAFLDDEMQPEAVESYDASREATLQDVRAIVGFALILLLVGAAIAVLTGAAVGRAVVTGERAIAEQAERLRTTLASIGDAVITTDTQGRVTDLNAVAEALTGWAGGDARGRPLDAVFRIVNEQTRKAVENPAARALREGTVVGLANHTVLIAKDGTERPIDDSAAPIRCKGGEVVGCVLVFRDISERRRQEGRVRDEARRTLAILESITDGFFTLNRDWRFDYVNPEAERILGRAPGDLLGKTLWEEYPGTVGSEFERMYRRVMAGPAAESATVYYPDHDRWYETRTYPASNGLSIYFRDVTERRRTDEALRQREERYRTLFDSMDEGFCIIEMIFDTRGRPIDYRIAEMNPAFEKHTGLRGAAGRTVREMGLDLEPHWFELYGRVALTGESVRFVNEAKALGDRWFDVYASRLGGPDSRRVALLFNDITERKRAEAALRASEERQRLATDAAELAIWVWHVAEDRVTWENDRPYEMFGLDRSEEPLNLTRFRAEFLHPDDVGAIERAVAETLQTGARFYFLGRFRRRDGDPRWVELTGLLERDAGGAPARILGTAADVTDRQRTAEALRASEGRVRLALDSAELGSWHVDPATMALATDERFRAIFGVTAGRIDYEAAVAAIHPDDQARVRAAVEAAARPNDPEPYAVEYRVVHPDGSVRWVFAKGRANIGREGEDLRVLSFDGTVADVTDRKRDEEQLRRLAADLSEADRRKDEFLATLAHELRNPLAPIRNALQILRLSDERGARDQARAMMERQLGQMVRLVDDLMDVSRITRGKLELRTERVDLAAVVGSAVETSRPLIEQMGHDLTVTLPGRPVAVEADLTRLAQVFLNLLNNAAKYTDRGGRITLSAERDGGEVVVSVADTGVGIAADQMPRIFEMFSQVDRSLEKAQGGLGIGLTLVKRLVEMHGGAVEARSEGPGKGSEFVVRLPAVAEASPQPAGGAEQAGPPAGLRILVVDDNRDGADSLAMMLRVMGNDTRTAYDGEEAVAAAGEFRPDVILLDIGLPRLNGYEACRRIRARAGGGVVIVAQTGWGQDEARQRTRDAGFDRHLVKPVDPRALMALLGGLKAVKA